MKSAAREKSKLSEKIKLQMIKEQEDVVIIAQTKQNQNPVMAYRQYGKGHILMIAVPLEFKTGGGKYGPIAAQGRHAIQSGYLYRDGINPFVAP